MYLHLFSFMNSLVKYYDKSLMSSTSCEDYDDVIPAGSSGVEGWGSKPILRGVARVETRQLHQS